MLLEGNASLLTRVWHGFFGADRSSVVPVPEILVYARNYRPSHSAIESLILELLAAGPRTLTDVTTQVAEQLMREEIATGSWATDVAVWGPSIFAQEASALIDQLDGDLIAIAPATLNRSFGRLAIGAA